MPKKTRSWSSENSTVSQTNKLGRWSRTTSRPGFLSCRKMNRQIMIWVTCMISLWGKRIMEDRIRDNKFKGRVQASHVTAASQQCALFPSLRDRNYSFVNGINSRAHQRQYAIPNSFRPPNLPSRWWRTSTCMKTAWSSTWISSTFAINLRGPKVRSHSTILVSSLRVLSRSSQLTTTSTWAWWKISLFSAVS